MRTGIAGKTPKNSSTASGAPATLWQTRRDDPQRATLFRQWLAVLAQIQRPVEADCDRPREADHLLKAANITGDIALGTCRPNPRQVSIILARLSGLKILATKGPKFRSRPKVAKPATTAEVE
jgi:hypothetical protein